MSSQKNVTAPGPVFNQKSSQMAFQKTAPMVSERVPFANSLLSLALPEGVGNDVGFKDGNYSASSSPSMHRNFMDSFQPSSHHHLTTPSSPLGTSIHESSSGHSPVPLPPSAHSQKGASAMPKAQFLRLALRSTRLVTPLDPVSVLTRWVFFFNEGGIMYVFDSQYEPNIIPLPYPHLTFSDRYILTILHHLQCLFDIRQNGVCSCGSGSGNSYLQVCPRPDVCHRKTGGVIRVLLHARLLDDSFPTRWHTPPSVPVTASGNTIYITSNHTMHHTLSILFTQTHTSYTN